MKKNVKYTKVKKDKLLEEKTDELVSKLSKFLKVRNEDAFSCDVEFAKTTNHHKHGEIYKVEVNLNVYGQLFRNESEALNLLIALDKCFSNLREEIKKWKDKKQTKQRTGNSKLKKAMRATPKVIDEEEGDDIEDLD
jgi:ribosome-associated translation inhibitor RaiA